VISPTTSAWSSPVVLVPKPDGSTRFCIDYRKLNARTLRDAYPLPRLDDAIDSIGEASWFTILDARSGFWQIRMDEDAQKKSAFTAHAGTYEFERLPFGLSNAPAAFQRTMDVILSGVLWRSAQFYIDDIIVFSKTF
jgi:Reverse transcriptase (RNA-dependent DNA polymerase)